MEKIEWLVALIPPIEQITATNSNNNTKIVIRRQQEHGKARPQQKETCRLVRKSEKEGTYKYNGWV